MTRTTGQRGYTIVEALIGITILSIVTLVMASTFLVGIRAISNEARVIAADNATSDASLSLVRDLSSAVAVTAGTINSATPLTLTHGSPVITVVYSIDANRNLIRTVNGTAQVAARGITSVTIAVAGCYATVTIQPSAVGSTASTLNVSNRPGGCF
ncbi:MAG TPA: type II secretion system protein [Candidatus Dormibacteraeota bacterium]